MKVIEITPYPAPRQVQSDKWRPSKPVLKYRAFKDELRLKILVLPVPFLIKFVMPMPPSWSEKKRRANDGQPHTQKPDLDNLIKAVMDALLLDDSHVHAFTASKIWGYKGLIMIDSYPQKNTSPCMPVN